MFDRNAIDEEQFNEIFNPVRTESDPDDLREQELFWEELKNES